MYKLRHITATTYLSVGIASLFFTTGLPQLANAQTITASSLAELRSYAAMDNVSVTMAPGEYWLEGDGTNTTFLEFSGSNSAFDLTGAQIKLDTREMAGYGNSQSLRIIDVSGSNNLLQGLDFSGHDIDLDTDPNARRYADRSAVYLRVTGNDNQLQDTTLLVRGSTPYGYGDVFGKGARFPESGLPVEEGGFAFLSHKKTSSFLVTGGATNTVIDNLDLTSQAYGHGFFVQGGATNTTIRNSTITGELVSSNDAIAHPEYQEYAAGADGILGTPDDGGTRSGTPLHPDIYLSAQEDGIRMYSGTTGLTVENTVVTNFRSGVHSTFAAGTVTIENVEAYGTENAFVPGSNTTITNSKADIVNGPAVYVQYNGKSNTTIDIEIVGDQPVGKDWAVAYLNGSNFDVTIRSDLPAGFLPEDSVVRFGQTWFNNWRDQLKPTGPETANPGPFTNSTFTNLTNEYTVLGNLATGNTGYSQGGVVTNGKDNAYDGLSVVLSDTRVVLTDTAGLGNNGVDENGTFDADIFESNASVVFDGATLELQPGIRISQEKLSITGDGVDGQGALYSDGTVGTDTRFGSANSGEKSAIFLAGDASIGVGVAGQQLNVGGLNGQGNFTKRGAGLLTVGKASTFDGDFTVAEGQVSARSNVIRNNLTVAAGASISANGNLAYNTDGNAHIDGELDLNARANPEQLTQRIGSLSGSGSVTSTNLSAGAASELEIIGDSDLGLFLGTITGSVSLVKSGSNSQVLLGDHDYAGSTTVSSGTLLVYGTHTGGGDYVVEAGGTLGGGGSIESAVEVQSGGTLAPGASAGQLSIDTVTLESLSTLEIELGGTIAGTEYDQLLADTITLGGDLEISLLVDGDQPFAPAAGDTFTVVSTALLSGMFDNISSGARLDTVGGEGSFLVSYDSNANAVVLKNYLAAGLLGDFNSDGVVDAADYVVWRDSLGVTGLAPFSGADATGDGLVTVADYLEWRNNFGMSSAGFPSTSVPEPLTLLLLLGAIVISQQIGLRGRCTG